MKIFIRRLLGFSSIGFIPLVILSILYIIFDPFKVIYNYDSLIVTNGKGVVLNQDYVSTTTFINNSKKVRYDSFIFGNSRSIFYQVSDWKKYIGQNAACYHFDASGESLYAINKKIQFIDKNGHKIDNILLILDYYTLIQDKPQSVHLRIITPALVNHSNIINFHKTFFFTFLNPKFLYAYLDFRVTGKIKPYMTRNFLLDDRARNYDVWTNELRFDLFEEMINEGRYYTKQKLSIFYERDTTTERFSPQCIFENQKDILTNISHIVQKHNASIKIVINPLYDQIKINKDDLDYLNQLFGNENVFDFSGINKFTNYHTNYYETSHYRPHVAREILDIIYNQGLQYR